MLWVGMTMATRFSFEKTWKILMLVIGLVFLYFLLAFFGLARAWGPVTQ